MILGRISSICRSSSGAQAAASSYNSGRDYLRQIDGQTAAVQEAARQQQNAALPAIMAAAGGIGVNRAVSGAEMDAKRRLDQARAAAEFAQMSTDAERAKWGAQYSLNTLGRDQGFSDRGWDLTDQIVGFDRRDLDRTHTDRMRDISSEYVAGGNLFAPRHKTRLNSETDAYGVGVDRLGNKAGQNQLGRERDNAGLVDRREKSSSDIRFANQGVGHGRTLLGIAQQEADLGYDMGKHGLDRDAATAFSQIWSNNPDMTPQTLREIAKMLGVEVPQSLQMPTPQTGSARFSGPSGKTYTFGM
jgi:hypothetical protein